MAATEHPIHPTTGLRAVYVSPRTGRAYWPVLGGDESEEAANAAAAASAAATATKAEADAKAALDAKTAAEADAKGFPENTPLEQMKPEQREAYWKHQSRRHEDRVKAFGGLTPEKLAELQDKAKKHDALELELGTTADKAAAKAADDAKAAARAESQPVLIKARLDAAAARAGVSEEALASAVEFVDTTKFVTANGEVDADKVKSFIATIAPDKGDQQQQRRGPSPTGQGKRPGGDTGKANVESGRERYLAKHPAKQ